VRSYNRGRSHNQSPRPLPSHNRVRSCNRGRSQKKRRYRLTSHFQCNRARSRNRGLWGRQHNQSRHRGPIRHIAILLPIVSRTPSRNYATYELFEISEPRWVSSIRGWNWLVCVRFVDRGHRRNYALLLNGSTVVDGHYAYQTDNCGSQAYVVFEQMGGLGLPPLH